MEKRALEQVEDRVIQILTETEKEIKNINGQIHLEETGIAKAAAAMNEAIEAGQIEEYKKAKSEKSDMETFLEMYQYRLKHLQCEPLIKSAEYSQLISSIKNEFLAENKKAKEKLAKLAEEMNETANELEEYVKKANNVLKHLQIEVYKNADRQKNASGVINVYDGKEQVINDFSAIRWGRLAIQANQYQLFKEE